MPDIDGFIPQFSILRICGIGKAYPLAAVDIVPGRARRAQAAEGPEAGNGIA